MPRSAYSIRPAHNSGHASLGSRERGAIACGTWLRALGIAGARGPECTVEPADVSEADEPVVVDG